MFRFAIHQLIFVLMTDSKIKTNLVASEPSFLPALHIYHGKVRSDNTRHEIDVFSDSKVSVKQIQNILVHSSEILEVLTTLSKFNDGNENSTTCEKMRTLARKTLNKLQ